MATIHDILGRGAELHRQGKLPEAEQHYRWVLSQQPTQTDALHLLGVAIGQAGRRKEGVELILRAIAINGHIADYHNNLGILYLQDKQWDQARASFERGLALKPQSPEALNGLGSAWNEQKRYSEALSFFERALAQRPEFPEALNNMSRSLLGLDRPAEAMEYARRAQAARPNFWEAHFTMARALKNQGQYEPALDEYHETIRLNPNYAAAHQNMGNIKIEQGDYDEGLACFEKALSLQEDLVDVWVGKGLAFSAQERIAESEASLRRAIAIQPNHTDAHIALSMLWLKSGQYAAGWAEYEWRRHSRDWVPPQFPSKPWDGSPLQGRSVLLHAEQGLGDLIQFLRFVPHLRTQTNSIALACPRALCPLLKNHPAFDRVIAPGELLPKADVWVPVLSLPHFLKLGPETYPAPEPYVKGNDDIIAAWKTRLAERPGFRVAVAWRGNPKKRRDADRSFPLGQLEQIARLPGVLLLSVQKDLEAPPEFPLEAFGPDFDETAGRFLDTIGVLKNVDLLIACDSAVAHLAGALGVPTWLALSYDCDWRWGYRTESTTWYPHHRLFRQKTPGDWDGVLAAMAEALSRKMNVAE